MPPLQRGVVGGVQGPLPLWRCQIFIRSPPLAWRCLASAGALLPGGGGLGALGELPPAESRRPRGFVGTL